MTIDFIAQPSSRSTLDAFSALLQTAGVSNLDAAAAYITAGGVHDLFERVNGASSTPWKKVEKRWLTSFDYCRSEPVALAALAKGSMSEVRIYDARFCLDNGGTPRIPFHPKAFLVRSKNKEVALAGSGNLSRSGLSRGVEAGLVVEASDGSSQAALKALRQWFDAMWKQAAPLSQSLLAEYESLFEASAGTPTPTEDDVASNDFGSGALTNADLLKLRVCRTFWIEAGNITRNRGPQLPGNQLMMKRLSRVFFGFSPRAVPENTLVGSVNMSFGGGPVLQYSLTYSDNKMDKLNLPMPGAEGPNEYDNKYLKFFRIAPGLFDLRLGTPAEKAGWLKKSRTIGGSFRMSSGREWGVF